MPTGLFPLAQARGYAENARAHARKQIVRGSTQIENNKLSAEEFERLNDLMDQERRRKDEVLKQRLATNVLEDKIWLRLQTTVDVSSESHLGCCHEYAVQALSYVLKAQPDINAEIFSIQSSNPNIPSGDHEILVLNRILPSDESRPDTWGPDAVICDPWADKVYPAREYLSQLEAYKYDEANKKNTTVPFSKQLHKLNMETKYNSLLLRQVNTEEYLREKFYPQAQTAISMLETVRFKLSNEEARLKDKPEKASIITNKITQINHKIEELNGRISEIRAKKYPDYDTAKTNLMSSLKSIKEEARDVIKYTKGEEDILHVRGNKLSFCKATTETNLKKIAEEADEMLKGSTAHM